MIYLADVAVTLRSFFQALLEALHVEVPYQLARARAAAQKAKAMFGFNRRYMPVGRLARALVGYEPPEYIHVAKAVPEYGFQHGFETLDACLAAGLELNTAWIFTPSHLRADAFIACAIHRLDIFCEKPIDMRLEAAEKMVQAARLNGEILLPRAA